MLEVTNVRVYDLKESVIACRNAMRLDPPEYTEERPGERLERLDVRTSQKPRRQRKGD